MPKLSGDRLGKVPDLQRYWSAVIPARGDFQLRSTRKPPGFLPCVQSGRATGLQANPNPLAGRAGKKPLTRSVGFQIFFRNARFGTADCTKELSMNKNMDASRLAMVLFAFISTLIFPFSAFPQHWGNTFQKMSGNGYFRSVGNVGIPYLANIYIFSANRYTNKDFLSDGYSTVIKGGYRYTSNIINTPASIMKTIEDTLKTLPIEAGDLFEFIFPYGYQYQKGYLLVFICLRETWGYLDCAQTWFVCTE
jgi:hypothetical protein